MNKRRNINIKGISLIVLVITIIIMVILATAVILALSNNGIIQNAKNATYESDLKAVHQELQNFIENMTFKDTSFNGDTLYADLTTLEYSGKKITGKNIYDVMPSMPGSMKGDIRIRRGQLEYLGSEQNIIDFASQVGFLVKNKVIGYKNQTLYSSEFALSFIQNGVLKIPDNPIVKAIGDNTYNGIQYLASVELSNDVETIGKYSFGNNKALTSVDFKSGIFGGSKLEALGTGAFQYCTALTEIELPDTLTSIGANAFYGCSKLTTVKMENNVVTLGSQAFYACPKLSNITLSDNITTIGGYTFNNCSSLVSINLPSKLKTLGGYAFNGCSSLKEITIPEGVTSIAEYAFNGCTKLETINLPASLTSIGENVFNGCSSLVNVNIDENNSNFKIQDGVLYNNSKTKIIKVFSNAVKNNAVNIPATVEEIASAAFYGASNLTSVTVDSNNKKYMAQDNSIYTKDVNGNPETLLLYLANTNKYTTPNNLKGISQYAFTTKGSTLNEISLNGSNISEIKGYTFVGCSNVTKIELSPSITTLAQFAFNGMTKLTDVDKLSETGITKATAQAFNGCWGLKKIKFGAGVTVIETLFAHNSGINEIGFGNSNYRQEGMFILADNDKKLLVILGNPTSVTIPNGIEVIGVNAIYAKSAMKQISLPNTLKVIEGSAFDYCTGLETITIPSSVTTIGGSAFSRCNSLTRISINKPEDTIGGSPWGVPAGIRIIDWF